MNTQQATDRAAILTEAQNQLAQDSKETFSSSKYSRSKFFY